MEYGFELWETKKTILGLIFDPDCECEINTPSK
jgi:hypothetical protein